MSTIHTVQRLVLSVGIGLVGALSLCAAADAGAAAPPAPAPPEALEWAFKIGTAIPAVPHQTERGACQYKALKASLDQGCIEPVAERRKAIGNWRQGLLCTDLAAAYGQREGNGLMFQHYLAEARSCRDTIDGHNAGWQKDRLTAYIALAQIKAGLADDAKATLAGVQDAVVAQVQVEALARIDSDDDYTQTMQKLRAMGESPDLEEQAAAVRTFVRILENHAHELTPARLDEVGAAIAAIVPKLPALLQCTLRIAVGRTLLVAGQRERGLTVLRETFEAIKARGLDPRFDVVYLADLASVYAGPADDTAQAKALLEQAAALLPGATLMHSERAEALVALGAAHAACSDPEGAWRWFHQALTYASQQVNGRPRHVMLSDLCVAIGQARYDLPADVRQTLESEWNRRGDPW